MIFIVICFGHIETKSNFEQQTIRHADDQAACPRQSLERQTAAPDWGVLVCSRMANSDDGNPRAL